jgi:hypothetical protein
MASIEIGITPSSEKTAKWTAPLLTPNSCFINKQLKAVYNKLRDNFISYWKRELYNDDNKTNKNKLRTYRELKSF